MCGNTDSIYPGLEPLKIWTKDRPHLSLNSFQMGGLRIWKYLERGKILLWKQTCPGRLSERHSVLTMVRKTEKEERGGEETKGRESVRKRRHCSGVEASLSVKREEGAMSQGL